MPRKIALLFAGQGAQSVGMGHDLAKQFPVAADLFRRGDEVLGRKLSEIAWNGPIEELTRTSNCQPALYIHGLACLTVLREIAGEFPVAAAAGLSLGEWTAHAAAGTFSFEEGLRLVEMKSTRKPIKDANLNGFFFGATEREYGMAAALGDRYLFAFIVMNSANAYGRPFAVLLRMDEVVQRTRAKRTQFQVNFRTHMQEESYTELVIGSGTEIEG